MKKLLFLVPVLAVILSSCSHYYYMPNAQNVPLFKEKNEVRMVAAAGSSLDIQAAYSVTNHIGVMANYMSVNKKSKTTNSKANGNCLEGGLGYFQTLGKSGVVELYGGYGSGDQSHSYTIERISLFGFTYSSSSAGKADLKFTKLFLQPSIGVTFSGFDIALSSRLTRLTFTDINNNISNDSFEHDRLLNIENNTDYLLLEPALTIRGGWKHIKLQLQYTYANVISSNDFAYFHDQLSVGLYISIANRFKESPSN